MRLPARIAGLVIVAVVALAGCVRITSDNTLHSDNTIDQTMVIALAPSAAQQFGLDPDALSAESFTAQALGIDPERVEVTDYVDDDLRGVQMVLRGLTLDEFNALADGALNSALDGASSGGEAQTGEDQAGGEQDGTSPVAMPHIAREGDEFVVSLPADPARAASAGGSAGFVSLLGDSFDFRVSFTFPGPVHSANRGEINGKTVTLGIEDVISADALEIRGSAKDEIAWGPILKWGGIALAVIAGVAGVVALIVQDVRRRRRNSLPAPETSDGTGVGTLPNATPTANPGTQFLPGPN